MFEMDADWTSDNPLFVISEGTLSDCHEGDDFDFKILDPGVAPISESWS